MRMAVLVMMAVLAAAPAAAQTRPDRGTTNIYITNPPKPMGSIEFLDEAGIERWRVTLSGEEVHLRISGPSCTFMGEIYKGLVTPLYDDMTFKTASGRECKVTAIER